MSTLRVRARSAGVSVSTAWPFKKYRPEVGVSSIPRIERNVDLPQPDGPETDPYSARSMSTVTSRSGATGPSESASNILLTFSRRMSGKVPDGGDVWVSGRRLNHPIRAPSCYWTLNAPPLDGARVMPEREPE